MEEVSGPVVGIALVLSAVFVPMAAMGGIKGLLNQQFAITIAISVLISAFNALKAEMSTEMAMVIANCWFSSPLMPPMAAMGTNTAESTRAMPTTGPDTSSMAFSVASLGARPCSM